MRIVFHDTINDRRAIPLLQLTFCPFAPKQGAVVGIDTEDENTFTITVDQKMFHFKGKACLNPIFDLKFTVR